MQEEENTNKQEEDKSHPVEDVYQYEEGEGNADTPLEDQMDTADTGDHGIGGSNGGEGIDNENLEDNPEIRSDNTEAEYDIEQKSKKKE